MIQQVNPSSVTDPFVIVIDDNEDDREEIRGLFPTDRISSCLEYSSGREFTEHFLSSLRDRSHADMPFLMFIDIRMQGMRDGIELLTEIRRFDKLKYVPAIMISGSEEESDIYDSYEAGANLYIVKTYNNKIFRKAIRQTIEAFSNGKLIVDIYSYCDTNHNSRD
jgi:CheY-like chemotaxis protein